MKQEKGLTTAGSILLICLVCGIAVGLYFGWKYKIADVKENSIKSNMLLIQGAGKVCYESNVMNKTTDNLVGTKLTDVENNEAINKDVINSFKEKNIIEEGEYEKYYIITDENLNEFKLYIKNEEDSYYLINYETEEVIITKGYEGKYKLSDITKEEEKKTEDNKEETSNDDNKENSESSETQEQEGDTNEESKEE